MLDLTWLPSLTLCRTLRRILKLFLIYRSIPITNPIANNKHLKCLSYNFIFLFSLQKKCFITVNKDEIFFSLHLFSFYWECITLQTTGSQQCLVINWIYICESASTVILQSGLGLSYLLCDFRQPVWVCIFFTIKWAQ